MIRTIAAAGAVGLALLAISAPAFAECDSEQEDMLARAIAANVAHNYLPSDRDAERAVDLIRCDGGGAKFDVIFRYSVERNGRTQWIEGEALGRDDNISQMIIRRRGDDAPSETLADAR